ncbi:hypothetical protein DPMN_104430 [Dreissena polymorpha]|uniref:Uncharacterized protein n=1 Tax=Dreissena polymorpha TaxID=45954 RepID=A0A9D4K311_DREPO|nr:hypothetical protein DPMN_104430 [Dreissena polymorpha]
MDQDNYPGGHYTPKNVPPIKLNKLSCDSVLDEDMSLSSLVPCHMHRIVFATRLVECHDRLYK